MYQVNVTQNVEPAMANPERMASAIRMKGEATKAAIGALGTAYETKTFMDMRQLQTDSDELANIFTRTGKAAEAAGKALPVLEDIISFDENVGPLRDEDYSVINNMKAEANRLRSALEGGMSNVQYEARVSDLTRKYLARYPGMSDKIRQIVGAATGLPGGDRWAASQYVQDRFSPKKDENSDAMINKDIDFIIANKPEFGYEELRTMRANEDPRYYKALKDAKERAGIKALNNYNKEQLESNTYTTVPELQDKAFNLFEGQIAEQLVSAYDALVAQGTFQAHLTAVREGKLNADELVAATQGYTTRVMAAIDRAHSNAKNEVLKVAVAKKLTKAQQDEMLSALNQRYESEKKIWGDKNAFTAQALVEQSFADASLDKRLRLVQSTIGLLDKYPPNMVESYFTNPEVLKTTAPDMYNFIDSTIKSTNSARASVIDSLSASGSRVSFVIKQASQTGEVVLPADATVEETRAAHQGVSANVLSAVEKINKTPEAQRGELTENMVRNIQALFTGITPQGGGVTVTKQVQTIRRAYIGLPDDDKATVKAAASQGSVTTVNNINQVISEIETRYGVKLEFGSNDAGQLGILAAPSTPLPVDMTVPLANRVDPNWAYTQARNEAIKKVTPMMENLVNTRLIVEEQDTNVGQLRNNIAKEFANIINSRQPYSGFFSLEPKPTAPAAPTTSGPQSGTRASMADIAAFASQEGMSIDEATSQLRTRGVVIDD
jgi:hypothetical protein